MKKIVIAGAGFAGIHALKKLKSNLHGHEITVIDKNPYMTMRPGLPDLAANKLYTHLVKQKFGRLFDGCRFIKEKVERVELENRVVVTSHNRINYDYIILALGSSSAFHGFNQNRDKMYTLNDASDAMRIREEFPAYLEQPGHKNLVFSGAGYTGIELACTLNYYARNKGMKLKISMVDPQKEILSFMKEKDREYIKKYLNRMGIRIHTGSMVSGFDGKNVYDNSKREFKNSFFVWTAGVKAGFDGFKEEIEREKDGRIRVDEFMQIRKYPGAFVCGDMAAVERDGNILRRAVNIAISSGISASENIIRKIKGKAIKSYSISDLGWIIPMQDISVGRVGGTIGVRGNTGLRLHYMMCAYRSLGLKNKKEFLKIASCLRKIKGGKR